jgi:4-diphosphocytidyl-2C-methyl-D-erythritol kinase
VRTDGVLLRHSNYTDIPPDDDLTVRAAGALKTETGSGLGVLIRVKKCLPVGGGLGGGSSNAATTLVALNHLWGLHLTRDELSAIGVRLGADVPVFIHGHASWAEGVGERLIRIAPRECWYLIIHPGVPVSTAEIFGAAELTRDTPAITIRDFLESGGHNDCEPVVRRRYPVVAEALDWLSRYGNARMTGTGSCIFAAFGSRREAEAARTSLPDRWRGYVAKGLNLSPLLKRLVEENCRE